MAKHHEYTTIKAVKKLCKRAASKKRCRLSDAKKLCAWKNKACTPKKNKKS